MTSMYVFPALCCQWLKTEGLHFCSSFNKHVRKDVQYNYPLIKPRHITPSNVIYYAVFNIFYTAIAFDSDELKSIKNMSSCNKQHTSAKNPVQSCI